MTMARTGHRQSEADKSSFDDRNTCHARWLAVIADFL